MPATPAFDNTARAHWRIGTLALVLALCSACDGRPAAGGQSGPAAAPAGVQAETEADATADAHEAAAGGHGEHDAHATPGDAPVALPEQRWASDPPLREGMRRMHRSAEALSHAEHDHLDAAQITAAARQVQEAANAMIAACKLAPDADAALHGLLSTLLSGAAALIEDPADTSPVKAMREAVALYPRMFDDPAWQADTAPAQ